MVVLGGGRILQLCYGGQLLLHGSSLDQQEVSSPVCISTDVVYEGAVLQHRLHFAQRYVLPRLQFDQVLFTV